MSDCGPISFSDVLRVVFDESLFNLVDCRSRASNARASRATFCKLRRQAPIVPKYDRKRLWNETCDDARFGKNMQLYIDTCWAGPAPRSDASRESKTDVFTAASAALVDANVPTTGRDVQFRLVFESG